MCQCLCKFKSTQFAQVKPFHSAAMHTWAVSLPRPVFKYDHNTAGNRTTLTVCELTRHGHSVFPSERKERKISSSTSGLPARCKFDIDLADENQPHLSPQEKLCIPRLSCSRAAYWRVSAGIAPCGSPKHWGEAQSALWTALCSWLFLTC